MLHLWLWMDGALWLWPFEQALGTVCCAVRRMWMCDWMDFERIEAVGIAVLSVTDTPELLCCVVGSHPKQVGGER